MPLISFTAGTAARSADVNANFALCVLTDTAKTVTVSHDWNAAQDFAAGTVSLPGIYLNGDTNTGLYQSAADELAVTIAGTQRGKWSATGLGITGALTVSTTLAVTTNATVGGTLGVTGAVTLSSTLGVTGAVTGGTYNGQTISSTASFTGSVAIATTLAVTSNATVGGTLGVTGATTLAGLSATTGSFSSTLGCAGNFAVNTNNFTVAAASGNTTIAGTLVVTGAITGAVTGNASTATTLANTRTFAITGDGTAAAQNFNGSQNVSLSLTLGTVAIGKGGTGLTGTPANGQLLIGNGTGYTLATITDGAGITVTEGSGTITVTNSGVTSIVAGTGVSIDQGTGAVTVTADFDTPSVNSFRAHRTTDQTTSGGAATTILFDTEDWDPGTDYNTGTGQYTVPVSGKWLVHYTVKQANTGASDPFTSRLVTNGTPVDCFVATPGYHSFSSIKHFNATNVVEIEVEDLTDDGVEGGINQCFFAMTYLGV